MHQTHSVGSCSNNDFLRCKNGLESFLDKDRFTGIPFFRTPGAEKEFYFSDSLGQNSTIELRTLSITDPWAVDSRPILAVIRRNEVGGYMQLERDCITAISNDNEKVNGLYENMVAKQIADWKGRNGQSNEVLEFWEREFQECYGRIGTLLRRDVEVDSRAYYEPIMENGSVYFTTNGRNAHYVTFYSNETAQKFREGASEILLEHYVDKMMNVFKSSDPNVLVTARIYETSGHEVDLVFYRDGGFHFEHYDREQDEKYKRDLRLVGVNPFDAVKRLLRLLPKYNYDIEREVDELAWVA